jgi:hypothetical protein
MGLPVLNREDRVITIYIAKIGYRNVTRFHCSRIDPLDDTCDCGDEQVLLARYFWTISMAGF